MKSSRFIFLFLFFFQFQYNYISAQQDTVWDIGSDQEKLEKIFYILGNYSLPSDRQIYLALRARGISMNLDDKKSLCLSYKYLGNGYLSKPDYESAIKLYNITLDYANELNDTSIISDCHYNLSFSYKFMGNNAEALKHSKIAFELDYARNDSAAMAESFNSIGIIYENMGDYDKALSYYLKSLEILELENDYTGIAQRYNNIGIIFYLLSNYTKAHEYLSKSIELFESTGNFVEQCKPLISMGDLYERTQNFDSSIVLFNKVLEYSNQFDDKYLKANILSRLGGVYFIKEDYFTALTYYQQYFELKYQVKDFDGVVRAKTNIAKIYLQTNNYRYATLHLKDAELYWQKVKSKKLLSDIYELYYNIFKKKNDISNALKYYELFNGIKDSIFSEDNNKKIYEIQTIYETEKKDKENEILKQSNKIKVLELSRAKTFQNYVLIILFIIFILSLFLFVLYRTKLKINRILNEKNLLLEDQKAQILQQKSEIEKKNFQITDSISYADLIQQSMFPNKQVLSNAFPESFIFFMPRDIVSGDFYWFLELDNKMVVAVADCTGHGVPAAFMSILGLEILSEIFEHHKIYETDKALNFLRESINKALHQEKSGNEDGMDIAICIIDKKNRTLEFSGAKMPVLIVEKDQQKEIKGDRLSIGGKSYTNASFTKHFVHYTTPFSIYLFSDGYQDQFGGPHNGKITSHLFRELLYTNSGKPMQEQKDYLQDFMSKWKGNEAQIDDILVVGIKIE